MLHTTFRKAKEAKACIESYKRMAKAVGGIKKYGLDTPIPLDKILEVCGLNDTLWTLGIVLEPADREIRLFVCDCVERVLPLFEKKYPDDNRPRQAIETARKFANGQANKVELDAADAAAWAAARDAALAARDVRDVAWAAARAAAKAAARDAGDVAWDAGAAVRDVAGAGARDAEREWQREKLLEMLGKSP